MKSASSIFCAQSHFDQVAPRVATATMRFRVTSLPRPPFAPFSRSQPQRLERHPAQSIQQVHTNTAQALTADVLSCHAENTYTARSALLSVRQIAVQYAVVMKCSFRRALLSPLSFFDFNSLVSFRKVSQTKCSTLCITTLLLPGRPSALCSGLQLPWQPV